MSKMLFLCSRPPEGCFYYIPEEAIPMWSRRPLPTDSHLLRIVTPSTHWDSPVQASAWGTSSQLGLALQTLGGNPGWQLTMFSHHSLPQLGSPQQKPKRLRLVVDVSGSMYRFNGVDRRLERSMEAVCMVMEAFENYEEKFKVMAWAGDLGVH